MSKCPLELTPQDLLQYVLGLWDAELSKMLTDHLAICKECSIKVEGTKLALEIQHENLKKSKP